MVVVVKERLFRTNAVNEEDPERDRATRRRRRRRRRKVYSKLTGGGRMRHQHTAV